jgi:hypothetical protein
MMTVEMSPFEFRTPYVVCADGVPNEGAGSGSTAESKVTLSVWSSKRDDHKDHEAESIPTRSIRLPAKL